VLNLMIDVEFHFRFIFKHAHDSICGTNVAYPKTPRPALIRNLAEILLAAWLSQREPLLALLDPIDPGSIPVLLCISSKNCCQ
jgi:hypothetical protein